MSIKSLKDNWILSIIYFFNIADGRLLTDIFTDGGHWVKKPSPPLQGADTEVGSKRKKRPKICYSGKRLRKQAVMVSWNKF